MTSASAAVLGFHALIKPDCHRDEGSSMLVLIAFSWQLVLIQFAAKRWSATHALVDYSKRKNTERSLLHVAFGSPGRLKPRRCDRDHRAEAIRPEHAGCRTLDL